MKKVLYIYILIIGITTTLLTGIYFLKASNEYIRHNILLDGNLTDCRIINLSNISSNDKVYLASTQGFFINHIYLNNIKEDKAYNKQRTNIMLISFHPFKVKVLKPIAFINPLNFIQAIKGIIQTSVFLYFNTHTDTVNFIKHQFFLKNTNVLRT